MPKHPQRAPLWAKKLAHMVVRIAAAQVKADRLRTYLVAVTPANDVVLCVRRSFETGGLTLLVGFRPHPEYLAHLAIDRLNRDAHASHHFEDVFDAFLVLHGFPHNLQIAYHWSKPTAERLLMNLPGGLFIDPADVAAVFGDVGGSNHEMGDAVAL
jgi:hypothetical protein